MISVHLCSQAIISQKPKGGRVSVNGDPEWTLITSYTSKEDDTGFAFERWQDLPAPIMAAIKGQEEGGGGFSNAGTHVSMHA